MLQMLRLMWDETHSPVKVWRILPREIAWLSGPKRRLRISRMDADWNNGVTVIRRIKADKSCAKVLRGLRFLVGIF